MSEKKRERTAQEILDAIARTEEEFQEIERFGEMSDEEVAKILAEHGMTPDDARAEMRKILDDHRAPPPPAKVAVLRRGGVYGAILLAAAFVALAGAGVVMAVAARDEPPPKHDEDPRVQPQPPRAPETAVVRGPEADAGGLDDNVASPPPKR